MNKFVASAMLSRYREQFGCDMWLRGKSRALVELGDFLIRAAQVRLPVLLWGERGTGREHAARILHLLECWERCGPFAKLDLSVFTDETFEGELARAASEVQSGTLFLASVESMEARLQSRLADILKLGLDRWCRCLGRGPARDVRLVAASQVQRDWGKPCMAEIHPALQDELDFLSYEIPPLRERPDDIRELACHFLGMFGASGMDLPHDVEEVLIAHPWPRNIPELRRVMAVLAAFNRTGQLTVDDLRSDTPQLFQDSRPSTPTAMHRVSESGVGFFPGQEPGASSNPSPVHPCVHRAVHYLRSNFAEEISLGSLSSQVGTSTSHLSHVFKRDLKISPMAFLTQVRIDQAKTLLTADTRASITEVADRVGFGDLRHFERTFKRRTGATPRSFRKSVQDRMAEDVCSLP